MAVAKRVVEPASKAPPRARRKRSGQSPFICLSPEHFAPFSESELLELTARLCDLPRARQITTLAQSQTGAALLAICGDERMVLDSLLLVWAPGGAADRDVRQAGRNVH